MKPYTITQTLLLLAFVAVVLGWTGQTALADPPKPRMSSASYALDWNAVGEISGGQAASAHYALQETTTGQMAANNSSTSASYSLCTGWECLVPSSSSSSSSPSYLNLPLLMR